MNIIWRWKFMLNIKGIIYSSEKNVNWEEIKSLIRTGLPPEEIDRIYTPQETHGRQPDGSYYFEVPFVWKYKNINTKAKARKHISNYLTHWVFSYKILSCICVDCDDNICPMDENINCREKVIELSCIPPKRVEELLFTLM